MPNVTTLSILSAEIDAADVHQALDEQPRGHEQRHRQRDLRRDERGAEARGRRVRRTAARPAP